MIKAEIRTVAKQITLAFLLFLVVQATTVVAAAISLHVDSPVVWGSLPVPVIMMITYMSATAYGVMAVMLMIWWQKRKLRRPPGRLLKDEIAEDKDAVKPKKSISSSGIEVIEADDNYN